MYKKKNIYLEKNCISYLDMYIVYVLHIIVDDSAGIPRRARAAQ